MVEIREMGTLREIKAFISFQNDLYKDVPYYVPTIISDEMTTLDPKRNPAYEHCETRLFMAFKDGVAVGRVCGLLNREYNRLWGYRRMRFCRFDTVDDIEVSKALLGAVEGWAAVEGIDEVMGPIGFCDMDKEGMLVDGFHEMGMFISYYNHPYYMEHMEALGYAKEADWVEYQITLDGRNERIARLAGIVERRLDLHTRRLEAKRDVKPVLRPIFELLNEAYRPLFGVVPLTDKQIDFYAKQFLSLIDLRLVSLVYDTDERLVGFGLAMPSLSEGVRKSKGRLFPFGIVHILREMKRTRTVDLYLIAVHPDYQGKGVNAIIMNQMQDHIIGRFDFAETGPELELNTKVQSQWDGFTTRQHKRRRCYIRKI